VPKGYPNILKRGQRFGWWKVAGEQYACTQRQYKLVCGAVRLCRLQV
jgi:hypothetical protein